MTPLHFTSKKNAVDVAKLLIDAGADINIQNSDRNAPLHFASFHNIKDIAKLLIDNGADISIQDNDGLTPLDIAKEFNHREIIELLEKHKENTLSNSRWWDPFSWQQ